MKVVVGDETGLVKVCGVETTSIVAKWGEQRPGQFIDGLAWLPSGNEDQVVAVHRGLGEARVYETQTGTPSVIIPNIKGPAAGFDTFKKSSTKCGVMSCSAEGNVQLHSLALDSAGRATRLLNKEFSSFQTRGPVQCARIRNTSSASGLELLVAGRENDVQLWDCKAQQATWSAENIPDDFLDLRQPIYHNDLRFFETDENRFASATAYREVRLYDRRAGQAPVQCINRKTDFAYSSLILTPEENQVIVGDVKGFLYRFDLRTLLQDGVYRGCAGSITSITRHPTLPYMAVASLDRFARIYDMEHKNLIQKLYLKQRLSAALFSSEGETDVKPEIKEEEEEVVSKSKSGKKAKSVNPKNLEAKEDMDNMFGTPESIEEAASSAAAKRKARTLKSVFGGEKADMFSGGISVKDDPRDAADEGFSVAEEDESAVPQKKQKKEKKPAKKVVAAAPQVIEDDEPIEEEEDIPAPAPAASSSAASSAKKAKRRPSMKVKVSRKNESNE